MHHTRLASLATTLTLGLLLAATPLALNNAAEAGPRNPTLNEYYAWSVLQREAKLKDRAWSKEFGLWLGGLHDAMSVVTSFSPNDRQSHHVICLAKPLRYKETLPPRIQAVIRNSFREGDWENIRGVRYSEAAFSVMLRQSPCPGR